MIIDVAPGSFSFKNNSGDFVELIPKDTSIPVGVPFTLNSSSKSGSMPSLEVYFEDTTGKRRKISTFDLKPFRSYLNGEDLTLLIEVSLDLSEIEVWSVKSKLDRDGNITIESLHEKLDKLESFELST